MKTHAIAINLIASYATDIRTNGIFQLKKWHHGLRCALGMLSASAISLALAQPASPPWPTETTAPQIPPPLLPFGVAGNATLASNWQFTGLLSKPHTRFEVVTQEGEAVLKISSDNAYGAIAHAWHSSTPAQLEWRWRVDQPLLHTDIATKAGDDAALKVCVMFDQPRTDIPLLQRAGLALARSVSGQEIPNATLCYVWDSHYAAGTSDAGWPMTSCCCLARKRRSPPLWWPWRWGPTATIPMTAAWPT